MTKDVAMTKVQIHSDFRHDCTGWAEEYGDEYASFEVSVPHPFRSGDEVDVPEPMADYFIRTGWAALPGEQPIKPKSNKPVFVQPDSVRHTTKVSKVGD